MDRNDFLEMVSGKNPIQKSTLNEIYELVDMFPYFQSSHLLLLKGLNDNEDVRFNKQLRRSSMYIANREILYYYLNPVLTRKRDSLTENVTRESFAISKPQHSSSSVNTDNFENKDQMDVILLADENIEKQAEEIFYVDTEPISHETGELLELDDCAPEALENISVYLPDVDEKELRRQQQSDLIDRFIIANPRIEQIKDKSNEPVIDISEPYLEDESGFVTETLARIYINQGYYSKAIGIYEKLNLKYPEKNSYFATQIEKIKEYIKN